MLSQWIGESSWKGWAFAIALLGGFAHAQSTPTMPGNPAAPAQPAKATLSIATLPDADTPLTSRTESASEPVHVSVGQSFFIKTPTRLKRIYVSNPLAVDAFASSPRQLVVTAKTAGVSSVILWDETGQSQTYMVSSDLDVTSLQEQIHQALPGEQIFGIGATGSNLTQRPSNQRRNLGRRCQASRPLLEECGQRGGCAKGSPDPPSKA